MKDTMLIIDEYEMNKQVLKKVLETQYMIFVAECIEEAKLFVHEAKDKLAGILLNASFLRSNEENFITYVEQFKELEGVPILLIVGDLSTVVRMEAGQLYSPDGARYDLESFHIYINRLISSAKEVNPLKPLDLINQVVIEDSAKQIIQSQRILIETLCNVISYRTSDVKKYNGQKQKMARILLEYLYKKYPEYNLNPLTIEKIVMAVPLHDIGKVNISDAILLKPGKLVGEEFEMMTKHTLIGYEILNSIDEIQDKEFLEIAKGICKSHHERYDGSGYPEQLCEEEIPIGAQIVSVIAVYASLRAEKTFRKAFSHVEAVKMILNGECGPFSPKLMEAFEKEQDKFNQIFCS